MPYFNYNNKSIYYEETGNGAPLLLLHGNTASSKMFEPVISLYSNTYHVITIDFLGHGLSERLSEFPLELWYEEAMQTIALLEHLSCKNVNLIGTSGGAWAAINVALERPDVIHKVIADSFDGRTLHPDFAENLVKERTSAKKDKMTVEIYRYWLGEDWESIVDNDTKCLTACAKKNIPLFHKPLSGLKTPLLLTGCIGDPLVRSDFETEYDAIAEEVPICKKLIFPNGFHPCMLSNSEVFAAKAKIFFNE